MSDGLPPLLDEALAVLRGRVDPTPPPEVASRLLERWAASAVAAPIAAGVATKLVVALVAGGTLVGAGVGAWAARTWLPVEPKVVEVVKTVEVVREVEVPVRVEVPVPTPAPSPEPKRPVVSDPALARERVLVDTARSAVLKADGAAALKAVEAHAREFPKGRLAEERESLAVQALVVAGRRAEAMARAEAFHRVFPRSLLGPVVDDALAR